MNGSSDPAPARAITRSLDGLRNEAKDWLRALRQNDASAIERLKKVMSSMPKAPGLRDVQHAIALEHGYVGWSALKTHLEKSAIPENDLHERANWFLEHACIDPILTNGPSQQERHRNAAMRILSHHPRVARANIHTAIVCGDVQEVARILRVRPSAATESGGPIRFRYNKARESLWTPILHLCYGRLPIAAASDNAVAIATLLLDHGANPNDFFEVGSHPSRYTALSGLAGGGEESTPEHPQANVLVSLLLERGADALDVQFLYSTALAGTVFKWFDRLYDASVHAGRASDWSAPTWNPSRGISTLDWLMHAAHEQNDFAHAEWLKNAGARQLTLNQTPKSAATPDEFTTTFFALDEAAAKRIVARRPELLHDYRAIFAAVEQNRTDVVAFLLDLGVPVDVADESGQQALHIAASCNAFAVVHLLMARGADLEARESSWNNTPLDHALYGNQTEMIDVLASYSKNIFQLASIGNVTRLREVLRQSPALARQQTSDGTPLMWLPDNEARAMEVVEILLEFGADPSIAAESGHTAAYFARRRGLEKAAELLDA